MAMEKATMEMIQMGIWIRSRRQISPASVLVLWKSSLFIPSPRLPVVVDKQILQCWRGAFQGQNAESADVFNHFTQVLSVHLESGATVKFFQIVHAQGFAQVGNGLGRFNPYLGPGQVP